MPSKLMRTSDQMQWKQEGTLTGAGHGSPGPSSRPLGHSREPTAGSNEAHEQDCQMSERVRPKLGFGSLFIFSDYLISQTSSFLIPNKFVIVWGDQSFHCNITLRVLEGSENGQMVECGVNQYRSPFLWNSLPPDKQENWNQDPSHRYRQYIYLCLHLSTQLYFSGDPSF